MGKSKSRSRPTSQLVTTFFVQKLSRFTLPHQPEEHSFTCRVVSFHGPNLNCGATDARLLDQLSVTGGGSLSPSTVSFPGAYKASDAGIQVNIHAPMTKYTVPGPAVIAGGTTVTPGAAVCPKAAAKMIRGVNDMFDF